MLSGCARKRRPKRHRQTMGYLRLRPPPGPRRAVSARRMSAEQWICPHLRIGAWTTGSETPQTGWDWRA